MCRLVALHSSFHSQDRSKTALLRAAVGKYLREPNTLYG